MNENPYKDLDDVNGIGLREYQVKLKAEKEQIKSGYSCVQERVKNLRQTFSEAVTTCRRSGSGQITINYYDEFIKIWGGSPASEPLNYGSSTTCANDNINADSSSDNPSSNSSNSLANSNPYNYCHSSTSTLTKFFLLTFNKNYFH